MALTAACRCPCAVSEGEGEHHASARPLLPAAALHGAFGYREGDGRVNLDSGLLRYIEGGTMWWRGSSALSIPQQRQVQRGGLPLRGIATARCSWRRRPPRSSGRLRRGGQRTVPRRTARTCLRRGVPGPAGSCRQGSSGVASHSAAGAPAPSGDYAPSSCWDFGNDREPHRLASSFRRKNN